MALNPSNSSNLEHLEFEGVKVMQVNILAWTILSYIIRLPSASKIRDRPTTAVNVHEIGLHDDGAC